MPAETPTLSHRNLPLLMLRAREAIFADFRPVLNAHGVTEQQWRVLRTLLEAGPLEPRQIGQACCMSSPSLTGVLARMVQTGLVNRAGFAADQRRVLVSASAKGRQLAVRMAPAIEQVYAALEARLDPTLVRQLYTLLDTLLTPPSIPDEVISSPSSQ